MKKIITAGFLVLGLFAFTNISQAYDKYISSGLSETQVQAILNLLSSFNADPATIKNVELALEGHSTNGTNTSPTADCFTIFHDLSLGSTDAKTFGDVTNLQKFLISEGVYPEARVTGYFGPATSKALQKWQTNHGITITTSGVGVFGPKTRAAMLASCRSASTQTQFIAEKDVPSVTYTHNDPGTSNLTSVTEPAFGEGVVVTTSSNILLPAAVKQFTQPNTVGPISILKMLYVNKDKYTGWVDAMYANEIGTIYMACTNLSKPVGEHIVLGKTIFWQCNPGAMGMITSDGRDLTLKDLWAAN
jgi:hypothetical protein